ncbi:hypothetical protein IMZ48_32890 [Candidatus Bathyarchaeota archaeon]|nr:hypothetical protein [Candidatus Bathyarchaeota archaeon]
MESPNGTEMSIEGGFGGYASSRRSSSETSSSGSSSSPTSTSHTSISSHSSEPLRYPQAVDVIASPPTIVTVDGAEYYTGETRVMADLVAQARNTGELPPTTSSPHDSEAIIHDHGLLARLRLARGDPALPPPEEYTRLRVEAARHIRDRDARLQDEECQRAATERVEGYLKVVGQERKYYDLTREIAAKRGLEGHGRDMERITEEVMAAVKSEIGPTAKSLDMTAGELDSAACLFNTVARSLGSTATTLNFATTSLDSTASTLNSTASTLENTLGVMATQISTLNTQLLALMNALQPQLAQASPTNLAPQHHIPMEDSVREGIEHAIREAIQRAQAPTSHETPSPRMSTCPAKTSWDSDSFPETSESTTKEPAKKWRHSEGKTRRPGRYMRIVINRILG